MSSYGNPADVDDLNEAIDAFHAAAQLLADHVADDPGPFAIAADPDLARDQVREWNLWSEQRDELVRARRLHWDLIAETAVAIRARRPLAAASWEAVWDTETVADS